MQRSRRLLALVLMSTAATGYGSGTSGALAGPGGSSPRPSLADTEAWIAYQTYTPERSAHAVHMVHPDGTGAFFALDMIPGGEQLHPDWSPDGRRLVLDVADATSTPDIWMADLTDWSARELVDCTAPCLWVQEPAWSRDGSKVAYQRHTTSATGEVSTIEVLDLASGATSVVYDTGTDKGVFAPRAEAPCGLSPPNSWPGFAGSWMPA